MQGLNTSWTELPSSSRVFCSLLELLISHSILRLFPDRHLDVSRGTCVLLVFYWADWTPSVPSFTLGLVLLLFLLLRGFLRAASLSVSPLCFFSAVPSSSRSLRLECWAQPCFLLLSYSQAVGNWSIFTHFVMFGSEELPKGRESGHGHGPKPEAWELSLRESLPSQASPTQLRDELTWAPVWLCTEVTHLRKPLQGMFS